MWSTSRHDAVNRNGAELCHAVGCRKHKDLIDCFRGRFCKRHAAELCLIREKLNKAKRRGDAAEENDARQMEIEFRKFADKGHMAWKLMMERM